MAGPVRLRCDGSDYAALGNLYAAAGNRAPVAVRRAVRRKGERAKTLTRRAVRDLLKGVKLRDVNRRVTGKMISANSYAITARGRIPLKDVATTQTASGVTVGGIDKSLIEGGDKLSIAFQGKKGRPGNQPGNAAKRLKKFGGRIVYGVGKRRREGFRTIAGIMVPEAFVDGSVQTQFNKVAAELPAEIAHQLWVVTEGLDLRASAARLSRGGRYVVRAR